MNNYKRTYFPPPGLKPVSADDSGALALLVLALEMLFISLLWPENKVREDIQRLYAPVNKTGNNGVICLFPKEELL